MLARRREKNGFRIREYAVKRRTTPIIMLLAVLAVALFPWASAQGAITRYNIGTIPDQNVWHGAIANFLVNWNETPSVFFSMEADPQPGGTMTLEPFPSSDTDWLFTYLPGAADEMPFTVTIVATFGVQTKVQSFVITPQPKLQPEQTVFGIHNHVPPVVTTYETEIFKVPSPTLEDWNNAKNITTWSVQIIGEEVVIDEKDDNGLYQAYFDGSVRRDITKMEIIGETVTFRSPAWLKQTDVTIYARNLRFEGAGQLKTTPDEISTLPAQFQQGANGLKAGNVTLNVSNVYYDTPGLKIDLTGGKGQSGGAGQAGTDGVSVNIYWNYGNFCVSCEMYLDWGGWCPPSGQYVTCTECGGWNGNCTWPTSGTAAKASGKPGEGGAGGNLSFNHEVDGLYSLVGGASGAPNRTGTYPWDPNLIKGGAAGTPRYALHVDFYWDTWSACVSQDVSKNPTWPTQAGADAAVAMPNTAAGPAGIASLSGSPYAWIHPLMLRKILNHAKEDYIGGNVSEAEARLGEYVDILDEYKADPGWSMLDGMDRFELEQMYDEMQLLLQKLANNLDYFGNPAGWVPMLSFEVNYAMFSQEIDRAIRMLYLAYWIRTTEKDEAAKADALIEARNQLKAEIAQAQGDYDDAMTQIPLLKSKAEDTKVEIIETQGRLKARENELIRELADPVWLACLKGALKGAAMACKMIPVYQPALGAVGEGLSMVSNVDPDKPWESILGSGDIGSTFLGSGFEQAANDQKTAKDGVDPDNAESKGFDYLGALRQASAGLSEGIADIKAYLADQTGASPEALSELERLKSMDPEYQELVRQVEALMLKNRQFVDELITTMQKVAGLSNVITRNLLAIDAMNRQAEAGLLVCDGRASAYLADMEQRTYNRLLKYHYYLAKSYEYRLLKPYLGALNLQGLLQKFQEIAGTNPDHMITGSQFEYFKAAYEDIISTVAEEIFDNYNANRPEQSSGMPFALTPDEIARLNQGETITLNLTEDGFFFPDEENVRIVDLNVYSIVTEPIGPDYGANPLLRLRMEHSGISNFKTDGYIYQFRHYNSETENPIIWEARWYPNLQILSQTKPSAASQSLLCTLLGESDCQSLMFFSRPSTWADLRISRECRDGTTCAKMKINSIIMELVFDYTARNETLARKDFEVLVTLASADGADAAESSFMPYFSVNRPDFNGRQDARGRFLRIYPYSGSQKVEVTAQSRYGIWGFNKWTDREGFDLPGGPYDSPTISLAPKDDILICAQYVPVGLCDGDFDGDGDVDGYDLAMFGQNGVGISPFASEFGGVHCNP